jgi:uncharacterized protein
MSAPREPLIDALRALALIGVVIVNLYGYPDAPQRFAVLNADPAATALDRLLDGLVGALLIAKAYPVLTFLFGYSLVLAGRRGADSRTRLKRLAGLGALHGVLLYFGDILLPYAVAGWWASRLLRRRLSSLRRHALGWLYAGLAITALLLPWFGAWDVGPASAELPTFAGAQNWRAWAALNASTWLTTVLSTLLMLPQLMALMLLGVFAGRLRLLTHRRWHATLQRLAPPVLAMAVLANAAMALCLVLPEAQQRGWHHWAGALTWPIGPAMGLAAVAWAASRRREQHSTALLGLAALGRRTLSVYLAHSIVAVLVLSGAGLALQLGRVGLLLLAAGLWLAAWVWAQWAERRGWRGPAEAWMARP